MTKISKQVLKYIVLFITFSSLYVWIEILFRNRSDRSMALLGGICGILIGLINNIIPWSMSIIKQSLIGGLCIVTPLEYLFGIVINQNHQIWDYSDLILNIQGQVCIQFSMIWCVISILVIILDDYLRYIIFKEDIPHYKLF